jgi:hypothetical protein
VLDPLDLPLEAPILERHDLDGRGRAGVHARDVALVDVAERPHAIDLADREELERRAARVLPSDLHPGADGAHHHLPVELRRERVRLRDGVDGAGPQQARLRLCALELRLRLPVAILGGLDVARGRGAQLLEVLLPLEIVLGREQIGLGLVHVAHRLPDVG